MRSWALASLPASIREGLLAEIFRRWEGRGQDRKKVVQKLWSALSTINICNFEIPPWIGEKGIWDYFLQIIDPDDQTRKSIITYINPGPAATSVSTLRGKIDNKYQLLI